MNEAKKSSGPRRQRLSREAREAQLLDAAYALFGERGYSATRIEDVAARAGVAKGLVAFYFPTKEDLFRAMVRRLLPPLGGQWSQVAQPARPAGEILEDTLALLYRRIVSQPHAAAVLRLLAAEGRRFPELASFYHQEVVASSAATIRDIVERGVESGEFEFGAIDLAPQLIFGPAIMSVFTQALFGPAALPNLDALMRAHIDFVLKALATGRSSGAATGGEPQRYDHATHYVTRRMKTP